MLPWLNASPWLIYTQIVKQIELLQRKADSARKKEVSEVVARIREAIKFYDLSADQLGFGRAPVVAFASAPVVQSKRRKGGPKSKSKFGRVAKYRDTNGIEWVGRGPRPIWLREALKSGKMLADFAIAGGAAAVATEKVASEAKSRQAKKAGVAKYKDVSGKTWSGRGRKPAWFVNALADGRSLESMAA